MVSRFAPYHFMSCVTVVPFLRCLQYTLHVLHAPVGFVPCEYRVDRTLNTSAPDFVKDLAARVAEKRAKKSTCSGGTGNNGFIKDLIAKVEEKEQVAGGGSNSGAALKKLLGVGSSSDLPHGTAAVCRLR